MTRCFLDYDLLINDFVLLRLYGLFQTQND